MNEQQKEIAALARQIGVQKLKPVREHLDNTAEFPAACVEEMRKADLFGVHLPEEFGGLGGGLTELMVVVEQLSRSCGAVASILAATGHASALIARYGTAEQKRKWLPGLAAGKTLAAVSLSAGPCLNGANAALIVFAEGGSLYVTEKPSVTKKDWMGLRCAGAAELKERRGELLYKGTDEDASRLLTAAQALGIAEGCLEETLAYITVRKQFKQTISSFQAIRHMVADAVSQLEAARAFAYAAHGTKACAMARLLATEACMKATDVGVQMCGGIGFMRDFPVEKFMRDAKTLQICDGTNLAQRDKIAELILAEGVAA